VAVNVALRSRLDLTDTIRGLTSHTTGDGSYQTLMTQALREYILRSEDRLEEAVRRVLREELRRRPFVAGRGRAVRRQRRPAPSCAASRR
jgi:hypothetical protein